MNSLRVALAVCVLGTAISACGGASNSGGDTTCAEFLAKSPDDRAATVARMLKERAGSNASTSTVVATRQAVASACSAPDRRDATIGSLGI